MVAIDSNRSVRSRADWLKPYRSRLLLTDVVVIVSAVLLAQIVRFGQPVLSDTGYGKRLTAYSVVFILLWLAALAIFRTRSPRIIGNGIEEYRYAVTASFWTFGVVAITSLLFKLEPGSRIPGCSAAGRHYRIVGRPQRLAKAPCATAHSRPL